jgi:phosphoglycerol transferase
VVILCFVLKLPRGDLRIPLHYNGDALLHATFIKGVIENGWYWQNNLIGAPGGLKMYDFPAVDNLPMVIIRVICFFTSDASKVLNLFYLLTFPLITLSSLYVFRQFGISYSISLFSSLLYAFMPYHLMRGESHLFLSAYYLVPLIIMALLWILTGKFFARADNQTGSRFNPRSSRFILCVVICVLVGSSGVYYSFFSCFLIMVAGASASLNLKSLRPLVPAVVLVAVIAATVVVNLSPSLLYIYKHGDVGVTLRDPSGAEIYGLKITQLILPITGHRVAFLNRRKQFYNNSPLFTENDAAALGLVGTLGFLALIARLFYRKRQSEETDPVSRSALLDHLSILNIAAVLLGTIGGLGSFVAYFIFSGIRSYNRISIFIAFFALFAVSLALEAIFSKARTTTATKIVFYSALPLLLILGVLDQTGKHFVPQYEGIKTSFLSDERFVKTIESRVPADGMVFQLPYIPFPEHPRVNRMVDYDHFRAYLHSKHVRWSYGAMKNREGDLWQKQIAALPIDQFVKSLGFAGFSGIYLDRYGYADNTVMKEQELSTALGILPFISDDGRLAFFDMTNFNQTLREQYSQNWAEKQDLALHPLLLDWRGGFSGLEVTSGKDWRWCSSNGELILNNTAEHPRTIKLEMLFATGQPHDDNLILSGSLISERLKINANPRSYTKTLTVPPGNQVIKFACDASRVDAPLDLRVLVFKIENFRLEELD